MRILTVGPTGVVAMQRVVDWMAAHGAQVWMVDYANQYGAPLPNGCQFVPFLPIRRGWRVEQGLRRLGLGALVDRSTRARLRGAARGIRPDVVHVHNIDNRGLACARAAVEPLLVSSWGALSQVVAEPSAPLSPTARQVLAATTALIVDAPSLVEPVRQFLPEDAQVVYLPLGADTRRFRPGRTALAREWRARFAIPEDAFVLLSPRNWAQLYGHQTILQAYALAFPRLRRPAVLAFVGLGDGPQALPHMAQAWIAVAQSDAAPTVRWLPRVQRHQMPVLYALADAVVNYPQQDSFPATLVEAAACRLPLVTALLPTYRGTFVETDGFLAPPGDPVALAAALAQVVNQAPEARAARLDHAYRTVVEEFDDRILQEKLWQTYQRLAGSGRSMP